MLNDKTRPVYEFIKDCAVDGISPTVREICAALGLKSTSTAQRYVNSLAEQGLIEKSSNLNRSIRLAGKGAMRVPLVGMVTAGQPITAIEDITDYINFQPDKNYQGQLFALTVRGDSMVNVGILSGDIVIVEQKKSAQNGDIVVALVENSDATVKRFFKENGHFRLQPENDFMEPIIVDEVEILGEVVAIMRYLK